MITKPGDSAGGSTRLIEQLSTVSHSWPVKLVKPLALPMSFGMISLSLSGLTAVRIGMSPAVDNPAASAGRESEPVLGWYTGGFITTVVPTIVSGPEPDDLRNRAKFWAAATESAGKTIVAWLKCIESPPMNWSSRQARNMLVP